jgi:hypothetical protein
MSGLSCFVFQRLRLAIGERLIFPEVEVELQRESRFATDSLVPSFNSRSPSLAAKRKSIPCGRWEMERDLVKTHESALCSVTLGAH